MTTADQILTQALQAVRDEHATELRQGRANIAKGGNDYYFAATALGHNPLESKALETLLVAEDGRLCVQGAARGVEFLRTLENQYKSVEALPAQQAIKNKLERVEEHLAGAVSPKRAAHARSYIAVVGLFQKETI
jgi:hypothetical protein